MSALKFCSSWVSQKAFEAVLAKGRPHETRRGPIQFLFPPGCKVMVDTGLRLLSLANQLANSGKVVSLVFEEEEEGTFGYLNRLGFFDHLNQAIEVIPDRPTISGAKVYRGYSPSVVEIEAVAPHGTESSLPSRLADALKNSVISEAGAERVAKAAFTVFAELIQNIHLHAEAELDGYAALQVYKQGGRAKVAVSDSGVGILKTLRPALSSWHPRAASLNDTELIVEVFREGLSRHGRTRGCGLQTSAAHALRFRAELDVRLPNCRVHLLPSPDGYRPHMALCSEGLPRLWGTHICFDFRLDN